MKHLLSVFLFVFFLNFQQSTFAQTITIPDANFEQALIDLGFDSNGLNGTILETDAEAVTELYLDDPVNNINLPNVNAAISDLTGLEGFINLSILHCRNNQILDLDVTNNSALTILECEGNQLTELHVTQNPLLLTLGFGPNNLTEIDVSQNLALESFWSNGNNLTNLNLDANSNLNVCGLSDNPLTYVSLQNGNNQNMVYFVADNTPGLTCINADAIVSQPMLNSGKTFSTDCGDIPISERNALLALYNSTDGTNWIDNTNWNTSEPESSWNGVTVTDGHVSGLRIRNNNMVGALPTSITTDLPYLETIDFAFNNLNGVLDDFSSISTLISLEISYNSYSIADLETNYVNNSTITTFNYQFQNGTDLEESFDGIIGDDYTLTMTPVDGTNVQYQWYKQRVNYWIPSDEIIEGATNISYTITNLQEDDLDIYTCFATSSSIPDLIVLRPAINITGAVSQADKDALTALYNATNGDSWNDNTNWLSEEPVSTWFGVTVEGNKVTQLDFVNNNLTGTLPPEIGNLTDLQYLSFFSGNSINGTLPPEIGNLTELRLLSVENNNFTGEIPSSYSNLTKLRGFWLWDNQLTGNVPEYLTTFPNLAFVDVAQNGFTGDLPDFTVLPELLYVSIGNNYFISDDFASEYDAYLNLQFSWNDPFYFSPQYTLDPEENITITEGDDIVLSVSESRNRLDNSSRVLGFQWYKDNVLIPDGITNPYIIYNATAADSGSYHCVITDSEIPGFEQIREPIIVGITLSVHENESNNILIYPVPTGSVLNISADIKMDTIEIIDFLGKQVLYIDNPSNQIDVSNISEGVYFLKLQTEDKMVIKRFIKN